MSHQKLYLCYSINDIFAREAGISMIGFFENNPDYEPDEVFILDYGLHPINKKRLDGIAANYGKRVTFLGAKATTDLVRREYPQLCAWRGSMAPNAKCFIEQIIPEYVERLLFIDADTVVAGSISELTTLDMSNTPLAVVPANTEMYFNSGVLLYNLAVWRSKGCAQMMIETLQKTKQLVWPDQDLLNSAIPKQWLTMLPPKYNYVSHYLSPEQELEWLQTWKYYSDHEINEAIQHPVIIHYLSGNIHARPWYEGCKSHCAEVYFRYKALSPWKDTPLFKPSLC